MVTTLLLIVIFLAYISLGLPDGLIGVAWPEIREQFALPLAGAGFMSVLGTIGATISSFSSGHVIKRIGTGKMVLISCALTGFAIFGFSASFCFPMLVLFSIPHGFGAGGVDSALNHFVSKHLTSRHMNWLHACWGIGASIGPLIMTYAILWTHSWNNGFLVVALIQLGLAVVFAVTLPEWKKADRKKSVAGSADTQPESDEQTDPDDSDKTTSSVKKPFSVRFRDGFLEIFRRHGLLAAMLTFFFYVGAEALIGFWSPTYLRLARGVSIENAGLWVAIYYGCITVGRIIFGIFVEKIGTRNAIKLGIGLSLLGFGLLLLPVSTTALCPIGLGLIGFGFAPMFPCVMQDTPLRFGSFSAIAIGYQLGMANIGYTLLPLAVAALADITTLHLIPIGALLFLLAFTFFSTQINRVRADTAQ
ncbi:MAG: MFS transporter [Clostridiales bacterium]|nr:MFS transporter [Clostridiales bacterium]